MSAERGATDLAALLGGPASDAAPGLLGCHLTCDHDDRLVTVRIEEVEAYEPDDPASHTFRGPTARTRAMFGPPGDLYVYRSHGIHLCVNVVCGPTDHGAAVLVRGGTVVAGRPAAIERRAGRDGDGWLAAGPGRLGQALGIRADDDGAGLLGDGAVRLRPGPPAPEATMVGPRVGVSRAAERAWRFWLAGAPGVSSYRRSPRVED